MLRLPILLILFSATAAHAQPDADVPGPPPIPDETPPPEIGDPSAAEPQVTIIRKEDRVIEEYRINGRLYKVKVTPTRGQPYYLLFPSGAEGRPMRKELEEIQTPHWIIFSW